MLVAYDDPDLLRTTGTAAQSPFVIAITRAGISGLPHVINACVFTSAFSASNSFLFCGSRVLYGLALRGQAPKIFVKCTKSGLPLIAVLFCVSCSPAQVLLRIGDADIVYTGRILIIVIHERIKRFQPCVWMVSQPVHNCWIDRVARHESHVHLLPYVLVPFFYATLTSFFLKAVVSSHRGSTPPRMPTTIPGNPMCPTGVSVGWSSSFSSTVSLSSGTSMLQTSWPPTLTCLSLFCCTLDGRLWRRLKSGNQRKWISSQVFQASRKLNWKRCHLGMCGRRLQQFYSNVIWYPGFSEEI